MQAQLQGCIGLKKKKGGGGPVIHTCVTTIFLTNVDLKVSESEPTLGTADNIHFGDVFQIVFI